MQLKKDDGHITNLKSINTKIITSLRCQEQKMRVFRGIEMLFSIFFSIISLLLNILLSVSQPLKTFFSCDQTSGGKFVRRNLGFSFIF